jgi:hypothetical protein
MIFLSYSRDDSETVDRLVHGLEVAGHSVWIDRKDVTGGDEWRGKIVRAVKTSHTVVVVLSPNSAQSRNVRREINLAANAEKRIVPVIIEPVSIPEELEYDLVGLQWVRLDENFDEGFERLLIALGPPDESAVPEQTQSSHVSLPEELVHDLGSPSAERRVSAISKLHELLDGEDEALATEARIELERIRQEDSDPMVKGAAAGALGASVAEALPTAAEATPSGTGQASEAETETPPELIPSVVVRLSARPAEAVEGEAVKWTVTVRNDGDDVLRQVTVTRGSQLLKDPFDLEPGRWRRFTFWETYVAGSDQTETVKAIGTGSSGESVDYVIARTMKVRAPAAAPVRSTGPRHDPG